MNTEKTKFLMQGIEGDVAGEGEIYNSFFFGLNAKNELMQNKEVVS